jgi:exopolyphosphatase/pppGpp-phosphohydrolase
MAHATPFGLLELGSNSLKLHLVRRAGGEGAELAAGDIRTTKRPWAVAYSFYAGSAAPEAIIAEVIGALRAVEPDAEPIPLRAMLAVATGVFRDLPFIGELARRVLEATGLRIRVISGSDEAGLMARGLRQIGGEEMLFFDLGGATTEWVQAIGQEPLRWGSLPLGAIRNECLFRQHRDSLVDYLRVSSAYCDQQLAALPAAGRSCRLVFTGGSARSVAAHLQSDVVHLASIRHLLAHVVQSGPPESFEPARRPVLLAGLVVLWRVLVRCRANELTCVKSAVRDGMVLRLARLLENLRPDEIHATMLLQRTSCPAPSSPEADPPV